MKKAVALFDIDKTIIMKDTMFLFLKFGIKRRPSSVFILVPVIFFTILFKFKMLSVEKVKEYYFYNIKYLNEDDLRDFFNLVIKKYMSQKAINEMKQKKQQGYYILLVSASPYAYLQFFKELPFVDDVIGTNLVYKNNKFFNKLEGKNCKGEEKVLRIKKHLLNINIDVDYEKSCAYSDSLSDLPMMSLVKNKYLIQHNNKTVKKLKNFDVVDLTWDS